MVTDLEELLELLNITHDSYVSEVSTNKIDALLQKGNVLLNSAGGYQWFDAKYMNLHSKTLIED
jgi:hypothetical protein